MLASDWLSVRSSTGVGVVCVCEGNGWGSIRRHLLTPVHGQVQLCQKCLPGIWQSVPLSGFIWAPFLLPHAAGASPVRGVNVNMLASDWLSVRSSTGVGVVCVCEGNGWGSIRRHLLTPVHGQVQLCQKCLPGIWQSVPLSGFIWPPFLLPHAAGASPERGVNVNEQNLSSRPVRWCGRLGQERRRRVNVNV